MTSTFAPEKHREPTYQGEDGEFIMGQQLDPRDVWIRACRDTADPEVFDPASPNEYEAAVAICADCPIARECRAWAVANHEWGVWGGQLFERGRVIGPKRPPGRPRKAA